MSLAREKQRKSLLISPLTIFPMYNFFYVFGGVFFTKESEEFKKQLK